MKQNTLTLRRRMGAVLCAAALLLFCLAGLLLHASAAASGSLSIWCVKDSTVLDGMHWTIYKVGHRDGEDFTFEGAFADYHVTLGSRSQKTNEWDAEIVSAAAETLRIYTIVDKIPGRDEGWTDKNGVLRFSGLEDGLYLVCGENLKKGQYTYVPGAIFFEMRGEEEADLNAFPKIIYNTLDERIAQHTVRKVWQNDADQPWNRSISISVELYRNGAYHSTVELSEDNDWSYSWEAPASEEWHCIEKVIPEEYTVVYRENLTQYLIVNTYGNPYDDSSRTDIQTSTTPDTTMDHDSDTTSVSGTGTADTGETTTVNAEHTTDVSGSSPDADETSVTSSTSKSGGASSATTATTRTTTTVPVPPPPGGGSTGLPQTGQLWWPVPILTFGGLLLIGAGLSLGRRGKEETDA